MRFALAGPETQGNPTMNIIAVISSVLVLALGGISLLRGAGYEVDLRKQPNNRRLGGRRVSDRS